MRTSRFTTGVTTLGTALWLSLTALAESPGMVENFEIPGPPTVTAATPPPPTQDRAKSSAAAVAMAMAAASQQKIACYMMMSEAMKEEDSSTKALMQAMAMQQCAQADQSMANAMKNKEGQKLVSGADIPKQGELKVPMMEFGKNKVEEADIPKITYLGAGDSEDPGKFSEEDLTQPLTQPNLTLFEEPPPAQDERPAPVDNVIEGPENVLTQLDPIDGSQVRFNDEAKGDNPSPNELGTRVSGLMGLGSPATGDGKVKEEAEDEALYDSPSGSGRGGIRTADTGSGEGGGSAKGSGAEDDTDYQALLQQMLGGGGASGSSGLSQSDGGDIVTLPEKEGDEDLPNIFEYASFRYRKLAYEKGQLRLKQITQVRLPRASTIARATRSFTPAVQSLDTKKPR